MALKIRLARGGAKKRPYYRIVVADSRMPRAGRLPSALVGVARQAGYRPSTGPADRLYGNARDSKAC